MIILSLACAACDPDSLSAIPPPMDPPDSGFYDATPPYDAGFRDAGFADAAEPPPAEEPIYIHTGATLYSYEAAANDIVEIGAFRTSRGEPIEDMADLAIDLQGRMIGGTVERDIYSIDPSTGVCTFRFSFDDMLHGMTFLSDGTLVVAGERVSLVNPSNGNVIRELVTGTSYQTSGDIVGLPDGNLYWTVRGGRDEGDQVIRIDPRSGSTRVLSQTGVSRIYGLGYAEGTLYGFSADGLVVVIDAASGNVLRERTLESRWWGATTNPVLWR